MDFQAVCAFAMTRFWLRPRMPELTSRLTPYQAWLRANRWTDAGRVDLLDRLAVVGDALPLISIVMPVYRPDRAHWRAAIGSILAQVYQSWQLCLCDDGSGDAALRAELAALAASDPRIVWTSLPANGGISAATNAAAALAGGEVILLMDQDDLLTPDCLGRFALAFAEDPALDLVYSDSDKIAADGRRHSPMFKPGWSPVLLLGYMYLSHALALRRPLFERLGGLRSVCDGSQDHDLALRAGELARKVGHIPHVLYHWRVTAGSTALAAGQKPESISAGARAVGDALARRGVVARVVRPDWAERADLGLFALDFAGAVAPGSVSVIVAGQGGQAPAAARVAALRACLPAGCEVLAAPAAATLGAALQAAARAARGETLVIVAGDVRFADTGWIDQLAGHLALPGVGLVAPRLVDDRGRVIAAGLVHDAAADRWHPAFAGLDAAQHGADYLARVAHECAAVPGDCLAIARDRLLALADLPALDGGAQALGLALSAQVRAGGRAVLVCAGTSAVCSQGASRGGAVPAGTGLPGGVPGGAACYNRNLGLGADLYRPVPRAPAVARGRVLRLVVVVHNLDREGAQISAIDLIDALLARGGYVPLVISPRDGELAGHLRARGIALRIVPDAGRRPRAAELAAYQARLAEVFAEFGADVVLANTLEAYGAVAAASAARIGVLWWQHEGGRWNGYFRHLGWRTRAVALAAFAQAYRVVQVSEASHKAWLPLARHRNFEVVRIGLAPAWVAAAKRRWDRSGARAALGLAVDEFVIVNVGSICRRKGQADILAMLRALPADLAAGVKVFMVGGLVEPKYHGELQAMLAALPADLRARVAFPGNVADPARFYAAADVFLCCSRQESAPRVLAEAQVFGLPIVTTPVDGIPELVREGVNALFYAPGDTAALIAHVAGLARSAALRERLRQGAATRIGDHAQMVERFDALLREAAWTSGHAVPQAQSVDLAVGPLAVLPLPRPATAGAGLPDDPAAAVAA